MKKVGAFDAKTHFSQLLSEVEQTQCEIIIQRRGKDIAILSPFRKDLAARKETRKREVLAALRQIRAAQKGRPASGGLKELVEDGRKR